MHYECLDNNKIHFSTAIYTHVIPNATNNSFCNTLSRFTKFRVRISNIALNNFNETWVTKLSVNRALIRLFSFMNMTDVKENSC